MANKYDNTLLESFLSVLRKNDFTTTAEMKNSQYIAIKEQPKRYNLTNEDGTSWRKCQQPELCRFHLHRFNLPEDREEFAGSIQTMHTISISSEALL
ncbi:hypothetical protein LSH36_811g00019 [Paralvinella palmiformis]|uniref:Uncharacterized protein n=1 Tax=Paralvinella palmiformis TaxID=53620 RepID=A0AAD9J0Q9_9ANNE|nr:hypothetical protein LSH36_811g00019 [Paralvinella palmiformis]